MHDVELSLFDDWPYRDALAWMETAWADVVAGAPMRLAIGSHVDEVVTLGRHAPESAVRDPAGLEARGAQVVRTDRGGGATAHGPGQIVLYPVVDLRRLRLSVPAFTEVLEDAVIALLAAHGVTGAREERNPGIFVGGRKIASLGFRARRGVVTHGLAINVTNDVNLFSYIVACGEPHRVATSLLAEKERLIRGRGAQVTAGPVDLRREMLRLGSHFCDRAMLRSRP